MIGDVPESALAALAVGQQRQRKARGPLPWQDLRRARAQEIASRRRPAKPHLRRARAHARSADARRAAGHDGRHRVRAAARAAAALDVAISPSWRSSTTPRTPAVWVVKPEATRWNCDASRSRAMARARDGVAAASQRATRGLARRAHGVRGREGARRRAAASRGLRVMSAASPPDQTRTRKKAASISRAGAAASRAGGLPDRAGDVFRRAVVHASSRSRRTRRSPSASW